VRFRPPRQYRIGDCVGPLVDVHGQRYSVQPRSVARHAREHLTPRQRAAILTATAADDSKLGYDRLTDVEREGVLAAVVKQRARLFMLADQCRDDGDVHGAIAAEAAIGRNLTLKKCSA